MLGNRIREYRKERGFSQEILAEKSGVSTNTISRIEGGQMAMSVGILQKIVKALGVDANTLLGVSTEVNETEIWVSAFSSRVQELKENEQEILKHTMNALRKIVSETATLSVRNPVSEKQMVMEGSSPVKKNGYVWGCFLLP